MKGRYGTLSIEIGAYCRECGTDLDVVSVDDGDGGSYRIEVGSCDDCLDKAEAAGYERCERENGL